MNRAKTINDVKGYTEKCINFTKCPLCFGCRNYNHRDPNCFICLTDKKKNICNIELHKSDLISKMITKEHIHFKKIEF